MQEQQAQATWHQQSSWKQLPKRKQTKLYSPRCCCRGRRNWLFTASSALKRNSSAEIGRTCTGVGGNFQELRNCLTACCGDTLGLQKLRSWHQLVTIVVQEVVQFAQDDKATAVSSQKLGIPHQGAARMRTAGMELTWRAAHDPRG